MTELDGILAVDKPEGPTSHDVVARARRALRLRRIGHTGTLDPFASGLLLLCLGPATRLAEYLTALPKRYEATLRLGQTTDTDDRLGTVLADSEEWRYRTESELRAALADQTGKLMQLPPLYSAKKVDGERMYAAARRGESPQRTPVAVEVYEAELTRFAPPEADFSVRCSAGTYIRAIARDMGEALGTGAHLTRLRRTDVGSFSVEEAVSLDALEGGEVTAGQVQGPAAAVAHLPSVALTEAELAAVRHGRALERAGDEPIGVPLALFGPDGALVAIGERDGDRLRPRKVLV